MGGARTGTCTDSPTASGSAAVRRRRLAGSGLGETHQVAILQQERNGLHLDRRRLGVAEFGHGFENGGESPSDAKSVNCLTFQAACEIHRGRESICAGPSL